MLWCVTLTCLVSLVWGQELVQNSGMETINYWNCWGFQCHVTSTRHSGSHAIQTSGRTNDYQGPGQFINLQSGRSYKVSAYVRLLNDHAGELRQNLQITVAFTFFDGTKDWVHVANEPVARKSDGWIHLMGDIHAPSKQIKESLVYVEGPKPGVDFIVDEFSVTPIATDLSWRHASDSNINKFRKSSIVINVHTNGPVDLNQVVVEVRLI
ncbi:endo-1,4-beta-xylanase 2-like [Gigantopelta aegis]|uniref:endo-1,4-beta-xylanase 2-like n=1 Tax=Gigantopelta aegis TaxID=1735272 RepID=UPI001B88E59B|nr:endo-1,4-beta-xylanase 2-like [Gigantopelta aegis]